MFDKKSDMLKSFHTNTKSRILCDPRAALTGFTTCCLYRFRGVVPGYKAVNGLWLLTGTPTRAKIVDYLGGRHHRARF